MTVAVLHLRGWGRQNGSENMPRKSLAAGRDSPNSIRGAGLRIAAMKYSCYTPLRRLVKANIRTSRRAAFALSDRISKMRGLRRYISRETGGRRDALRRR